MLFILVTFFIFGLFTWLFRSFLVKNARICGTDVFLAFYVNSVQFLSEFVHCITLILHCLVKFFGTLHNLQLGRYELSPLATYLNGQLVTLMHLHILLDQRVCLTQWLGLWTVVVVVVGVGHVGIRLELNANEEVFKTWHMEVVLYVGVDFVVV